MQQEIAEVQVGVKNFIYHGQYQPYTNDVALLKLARPVKFNNYIQPVCLPSGGQQPSNPNNCYASGWGRIYSKYKVLDLQWIKPPSSAIQTDVRHYNTSPDPLTLVPFQTTWAPTPYTSGNMWGLTEDQTPDLRYLGRCVIKHHKHNLHINFKGQIISLKFNVKF